MPLCSRTHSPPSLPPFTSTLHFHPSLPPFTSTLHFHPSLPPFTPLPANPSLTRPDPVFTVTIASALQARPASYPFGAEVPFNSDFTLIAHPTFTSATTAISSIVFAYSGTPAFFGIIAEMRHPAQHTRSLLLCQSVVTTTYLTVGIVIYIYCGSYVSSPALGSAGPLIKKVCYGMALPGLVVSTMLFIHFAAKTLLLRLLRGSKHLTASTPTHYAVWLGLTGGTTLIAYVIASAIPIFGSLTSLIGALLGTLQCFLPMACMWIYDNWRGHAGLERWGRKCCAMLVWVGFVFVVGLFLMVAGTYASVQEIVASYARDGGSRAWSCEDNSGSV
jgi:hypothetical protein